MKSFQVSGVISGLSRFRGFAMQSPEALAVKNNKAKAAVVREGQVRTGVRGGIGSSLERACLPAARQPAFCMGRCGVTLAWRCDFGVALC